MNLLLGEKGKIQGSYKSHGGVAKRVLFISYERSQKKFLEFRRTVVLTREDGCKREKGGIITYGDFNADF